MALVFIVDDDPVNCEAVAAALKGEGHELRTFTEPQRAVDAGPDHPAVAITDFAMPSMNGREFVTALRSKSPNTTFVVVSGQVGVEETVALLRDGVVDVLSKPPRARALRKSLALALSQHELSAENYRLKEALRTARASRRVIGTSPAFRAVLEQVERVAPSAATVLLLGETGTGKEVLADAVHEQSPRGDGRLVKINCAAIPESLLESELFGHKRGAFTGAIKDKAGLFEQAHAGTIFLDEVGELPPAIQAKLLRVLQDGQIQRIGDESERRVDVRVIAATNRDLREEVEAGRFREDLFFRLNVITIAIPPLRQRGDDVLLLARHFLDQHAERGQQARVPGGFSPDVLTRLRNYNWPGNVRELENVIARAVALAEGTTIQVDDLPSTLTGDKAGGAGIDIVLPETITLQEAEKVVILRAVEQAGGNKKLAADRLGIGLATLYRKLATYENAPQEDD